jgi:hypothetical protein
MATGEIEIVFTGLCCFLNLRNRNKTMGDPSVILVHTPNTPGIKHIPYIAFEKSQITVDPPGDATFQTLMATPPQNVPTNYMYRALKGVELHIEDDMPGTPEVTPSYDFVARKDDYWPYAKDQWNDQYVTAPGDNPDPASVEVLMRFGGGAISAERITDFEWIFRDQSGQPALPAYYAQEVLYRIYPSKKPELRLHLTPLEDDGTAEEVLVFKPGGPYTKIKIWIGNSDDKQIDKAVLRVNPPVPDKGIHFEYLNRVASVAQKGPIPEPHYATGRFPVSGGGAGGDTGYCGPSNGDGG